MTKRKRQLNCLRVEFSPRYTIHDRTMYLVLDAQAVTLKARRVAVGCRVQCGLWLSPVSDACDCEAVSAVCVRSP